MIVVILLAKLVLQGFAFQANFMAVNATGVNFVDVLLLSNLTRFVTLIPLFLDIGILELSAIYLFQKAGIGGTEVFCAYITQRTLNYIVCLIIILIDFFIKRRTTNHENRPHTDA
jgi:hypothetical protein